MTQRSRIGFIVIMSVFLVAPVAGGIASGGFHPEHSLIEPGDRTDGDCLVGSHDTAGYQGYYSDVWDEDQAYAMLIEPQAEGCGCAPGVTVTEVHMLLRVNQYSLLVAQAELWSGVDTGGGCWEPLAPLAISPAVEFSGYTGELVADIKIPINTPCMTTGDAYYIVVRYLPASAGAFIGIPVDDSPEVCTGRIAWPGSSGWHDPVSEYGWIGDFYVYADLDCCSEPVTSEVETWSTLKQYYR